MAKEFDELEYTRDREIKTLLAIQAHATDGSALEGCTCLQGKHFYELENNSEEGMTIADREKEKEFYAKMGPFARQARKAIVDQTWEFPKNIIVEKPHALVIDCEKKIEKCLLQGHTEEECLLKYPCP